MIKLEDVISKELLSHVLGRKVWGFCKDNYNPDKILKTTCYMLYNNLDSNQYHFTKLELAYLIKEWIKNKSYEHEIPSTNIHSGFDDEIYEDGYFCILGQGWSGSKKFYDNDEVFAIIKAGEYFLNLHYDVYLYRDELNWK